MWFSFLTWIAQSALVELWYFSLFLLWVLKHLGNESFMWLLVIDAMQKIIQNLVKCILIFFFFLFCKHYSSNRAHVLIVKLHHWSFPWNLRYLWRKNILLIWQGNSEFVLFDLAKYISIRKKCSVSNLNIFHIIQVMILKSLMVKYKRNLLYNF